ncbi:Uncharacterised protein [Mycolicibacterium fortuitum]|uniref:Uncharacterized protein n=1 Tax=Mycolicibacterium fortuitum TaxID=1766 RepID=A0A378WEF3_MYCFO|nr:Uncharacterised protein [Mycolicibacterium fortuitum]
MCESDFSQWLDAYVEEKELDRDHHFEVAGTQWPVNIIPVAAVVEAAKAASPQDQGAIRDTLVRIDFHHADPMHYFEYLAKGMAL